MNSIELAKVKDGMPVLDFQGRVEKVFKQEDFSYKWEGKTITGKKQNLIISGVLFEIKDRKPYEENIKDNEIEILSTFNDKRQQWFGMKKSSYKDKNGKTVLKVSVTPSADIKFYGESPLSENGELKMEKDLLQKALNTQFGINTDKDLFIARQSCLKVAAEFSKGRDYIKSPTEIVEIAQIFLNYVCCADKRPDDIQDVKELESVENCENVGDEEIPF